MTPVPIVALHAAVLSLISAIAAVLCREITPVGTVFAVIPIVVVAIVPVINSDMDTGVLRFGVGHHDGWYGESSDK